MTQRQRLDAELVRRKLADSRSQADQLVAAGVVLVGGAVAAKSSRLVHAGEPIVISEPPRFVSRGGLKLDAALDHFGVDVAGHRVLDAGASTGGFTDCLLQRGAAHVTAVDVGHGQLHPRIRHDERVTVFERFHIRDASVDVFGESFDMVVADLSFISLRVVLAPLVAVSAHGGAMVLLVKPQFEAGRDEVSRGRGIISDPATHQRVCDGVAESLVQHGCHVHGFIESPIHGGDGNKEFLVYATVGVPPCPPC